VSDELATLAYRFGTVSAKVHRGLRAAVRVTGMEAEAVMKAEVPVDTGALRNSTRALYGVTGETVDVGPTVNYAPFVAYGTRRQRPNPFDLRTAEKVGPQFVQRCNAVVSGGLL
jgi:HK97 gp10 family phage protein